MGIYLIRSLVLLLLTYTFPIIYAIPSVEDFLHFDNTNLTNQEIQLLEGKIRSLYEREFQIYEQRKLRLKKSADISNFSKKEGEIFFQYRLVTQFINQSIPSKFTQINKDQYIGLSRNNKVKLFDSKGFRTVDVLNIFMRSSTGCSCRNNYQSKNCACCETGGCLCKNNQNRCGKCSPGLIVADCNEHKEFQHLAVTKNSNGRYSPIFILATETTITFYKKAVSGALKPELYSKDNEKSLLFLEKIQGISLQDLPYYIDELGKSAEHLLFVFLRMRYVIYYNAKDFWKQMKTVHIGRSGLHFDIIQIGESIYVGYISHQGHFYVTKEYQENENQGKEYISKTIYAVTDVRFSSWQTFSESGKTYILLRSSGLVRIYLLEVKLNLMSEIYLQPNIKELLTVNFPDSKGKAIIILMYENHIDFYIRHNFAFKKANPLRNYGKNAFVKGSAVNFNVNFYLLVEKTGEIQAYKVILAENGGKNTLTFRQLEKLRDLKAEYENQNKLLNKIERTLNNSLYKSKETQKKLILSRPVIFKEPVKTTNINGTVNTEHLESYKQSMQSLQMNVELLQIEVNQTKTYLKDVVPKSGSKNLIKGIKHFYGPKTVIKEFVIDYASIGNISSDENSIDDTIHNLVRIDDDRQIKGRKFFRNKISTKDLRTSTLNGKNTSYYITANHPVKIKSAVFANGISIKNDIVMSPKKKVDGIDISELVKKTGYHEVGACYFKNLKASKGIEVLHDRVNKGSFSNFVNSLFKVKSNITMQQSAFFKNLSIRNNLKAISYMGVTSNMLRNIALKSKDEKIMSLQSKSTLHFRDLKARRINNEMYPEDFVVKSQEWINFGSKSFQKVNFHELSVTGNVDGVKTSDLVTQTTPQEIFGNKIFANGIKIIGNLNIQSSLVNGIDINLLFNKPKESNARKNIIFEKPVIAPTITVEGKVNNMSLTNLKEDLIYKNTYGNLISGRKIFRKNLKLKSDAKINRINQYTMSNFVNLNMKNEIKAKKIFTKNVTIKSIKVDGLIDGINLKNLIDGSLYVNKPNQVVVGSKNFRHFSSSDLDIRQTLNHEPIKDLLTKSTEQVLPVHFLISNGNFKNIKAGSVVFKNAGLVNGFDLSRRTDKINYLPTLLKELEVRGHVISRELKVHSINNLTISNLQNNLLLNYGHQTINIDIEFDNLEIEGSASTSASTTGNAVSLRRKASFALRTNSKNIIKDMIWDDIDVKELQVPPIVNGINLKEMESDLVYLDNPSTFSVKGKKHFLNGFRVNGDVMTSFINGKNFSNLFSKTMRQDIDVPITFHKLMMNDIYIRKFNSYGFLYLMKKAEERKFSAVRVNGPITFHGRVQAENLILGSNINGYDMEAVMQDAVEIRGRNSRVYLSGGKRFKRPVAFTELFLESINGNMAPLLRRRANLKDKKLREVHIKGTVTSNNVQAHEIILEEEGNIFFPDYIRNKYVLVSEEIESHLNFESLVIHGNVNTGKLNNQSVGTGFLSKNSRQLINNSLTMQSFDSKNVFVHGRINGYKLPNSTVIEKKLYTKIIDGEFRQRNGLKLKGNVIVKGRIGERGLVIPNDLIFLGKNNSIKGTVSFVDEVIAKSLKVSYGKVKGMRLQALKKFLDHYRGLFEEYKLGPAKDNFFQSRLANLKNIYLNECNRTAVLQKVLAASYIEPHTIELSNILQFNNTSGEKVDRYGTDQKKSGSKHTAVLKFQIQSKVWVIDSIHYGNCETRILSWDETKHTFSVVEDLGNIGDIHQWVELYSEQDFVYLLGVSSGSEKCGEIGSSYWKASYWPFNIHKVDNMAAAEEVIVEKLGPMTTVHFLTGYEKFISHFSNGQFVDRVFKEHIPIRASVIKNDGQPLKVGIWNNNFIGIVDSNEERVLSMAGVEEIYIFKHLKDVYFICRIGKRKLHGHSMHYEVYHYHNMSLVSIGILDVGSPSKIQILEIPMDETNSTLILALYEKGFPKIFRFNGIDTKLWSELPTRLSQKLFSFDFIDPLGNYFLTYGDIQRMVTVKFILNGVKFTGEINYCH